MTTSTRSSASRTAWSLLAALALLLTGILVAPPAHAADGGSVSGTVTAEDGIDLEVLRVELWMVEVNDGPDGPVVGWGYETASTAVDGTGSFGFSELDPSENYTIAVSGPGVGRAFHGGAVDVRGAEWFTGEHDVTGIDLVVGAGALATGTVLDLSGAPVEAAIDAYVWDDSRARWAHVGTTWTDLGAFSFDELHAGVYAFYVSPYEGSAYPQYIGGAVREPAAPDGPNVRHLSPGVNAPVDIQLVAGRTVSGTITVPAGVDVDLLTVQLIRGEPRADGEGAEHMEDVEWLGAVAPSAGGTYTLGGMAAGEQYTLLVNGPGVMPQVLGGGAGTWEADWIVGDTNHTGINFTMAGAGRISGVVRGPDGESLSNVFVQAHEWTGTEWTPRAGDWTASDGTYTIGGLPLGTYVVKFHVDHAGTAAYSQLRGGGTQWPTSPDDPQAITLRAGETRNLDDQLLAGRTVSGAVSAGAHVDLTRLSVTLGRVEVDEYGGSDVTSQTTVAPAADGTYTLTGMAPGSQYAVTVSGPGIIEQRVGRDGDWISGDTDRTGVDFDLDSPAQLAGIVRGPNGSPYDGVAVTAYRWDGEYWSWTDSTKSESDGSFELAVLPPGDYAVEFSPDDTRTYPQFLGGSPSLPSGPDDEHVLHLTAGLNPPVDATLHAGSTVSGTVSGLGLLAADGARVHLYTANIDDDDDVPVIGDGDELRSVPVDEDGTYEITGLKPGRTYTVALEGDGLPRQFYGGAATIYTAQWFTADGDVTGIDIAAARGGRLDGTVVDPAGAPLAGVRVRAYVWSGTVQRWRSVDHSWSDEGGRFDLGEVLPGAYTLHFDTQSVDTDAHTQYLGGSSTAPTGPSSPGVVVVTPGSPGLGEVGLAVGGVLQGSVALPDGADPESFSVDVYRVTLDGSGSDASIVDHEWVGTEQVRADGTFRLRGLDEGAAYTVLVDGDGFAPLYYGGTSLIADASWFRLEDAASLVLDYASTGSARVQVTVAGSALGNAKISQVSLLRWTGSRWTTIDYWTLDGTGSATPRGLAPGVYTVHFTSTVPGVYEQYLGGSPDQPGAPTTPLDATRMFQVTAGEITDVDMDLVRSISVSGTVTVPSGVDLGTFEVVASRMVSDGDDRWCEDDREVSIDATGGYVVDRLVPGETYTLGFRAEGDRLRYLGGGRDCESAQTFVATTGLTLAPFAYVQGATVSGTVIDAATGDPVPGTVELDLLRWDASRDSWRYVTGAEPEQGSYSFRDLEPGVYTMRSTVWDSDVYPAQYLGGSADEPVPGDEEATFTVVGAEQLDQDIRLARSATVSGRILGAPDPTKVEVRLLQAYVDEDGALDDWWETPHRVTPSSDGSFELPGMFGDNLYTLKISGPGIATSYFTPSGGVLDGHAAEWWIGTANVTGKNFTARAGHDLQLMFRTAGGAVPESSWVVLSRWVEESSTWDALPGTEAGIDGAATFSGLAPGRYAVRVEPYWGSDYPSQWAGGLVSRPGPTHASVIEISTSSPGIVTHEVPLARGGHVTGSLADAGRGDYRVSAMIGETLIHAEWRESGDFDLVLLPGRYDVRVDRWDDAADDYVQIALVSDVTVTTGGTAALGAIDVGGEPDPHATVASATITGTAAVGRTLTASATGVTPASAGLTYQWLRDGDEITGATSSSYAVTLADVGAVLAVRVTARASGYVAASVESDDTDEVPRAASAVALAASGAEQTVGGTPVTLTATVTQPAGVTAPGSVRFLRGGSLLATVAVGAGKAAYTLPASLAVGTYAVTAEFVPGDARVSGKVSAAVTVTVRPAPVVVASSTTTLTLSSSKQTYGAKKRVVLTASVVVAGGAPSGKVVFKDGAKTLGTVTVKGGKAALTVKSTLAVGRHRVTAQFLPSAATVRGSTSAAATLTVSKAKASVTTRLVKKSVTAKSKAKLKVTVKVTGVSKPTGTLVVYDGKKKIATVKLTSSRKGVVTVTLPKLAKGKHRIKVAYSGSKSIAKKTSKVATLTVR